MKNLNHMTFLSLSIIVTVSFGCQKHESSDESSTTTNTPSYSNVQSVSGTQSFWKQEITKEDFVDLMDDAGYNQTQIDDISPELLETITLVVAKNGDRFEMYLSAETDGEYSLIGDTIIEDLDTSLTMFEFKEENGYFYIDGEEQVSMTKLSDSEVSALLEDIILPAYLTCCKASWIVHDILGIHNLDCICCFGTCGFSCTGLDYILWSADL